MILVYRELGLSLKEISRIGDAPDYDQNRALEHQIGLMQEKVSHLQNRISFAKGMLLTLISRSFGSSGTLPTGYSRDVSVALLSVHRSHNMHPDHLLYILLEAPCAWRGCLI